MVLIDTNILIDVLARREPFYNGSARVTSQIAFGRLEGGVSAHAVTTVHYIVEKSLGHDAARDAVEWVLGNFEIFAIGPDELKRARDLSWADFKDAVTAVAAESARCKAIVTRNTRDFHRSRIPALLPEELVIDEVHESFTRRYGSGGGAAQAGGGSTRKSSKST